MTAAELQAAHSVHPIAAVESEWSIWTRDVENEVVPTAARLGVGIVPYAPLGRGFLTGTVTGRFEKGDFRRGRERFAPDALAANAALLAAIAETATAYDATPAQVALAWLIGKEAHFRTPVVPIPGTRRATRVDENVAALRLALDPLDAAKLDAVADAVVGSRAQGR